MPPVSCVVIVNHGPLSRFPDLRALRHRVDVRACLASVALLLAVATPSVGAQPVAGLGEDAIPIPLRALRVSIGAQWDQWDRRLLPDGARAPLLDGMSAPVFGTAQLPALSRAERGIRDLLGATDFQLSLGALEARGGVRRSTSVLQADFGLTRRISLGVRVPYVEVVHDARLVLNRDGTGANVGANPQAANNGVILNQIGISRNQLLNAITNCGTDGTGPVCEAILANPAAATSLAARAAAFSAAWNEVYGDGAGGGAPVVPVQGSPTHTAIASALAALREDFSRYFQTAIPPTGPNGALLVYGTSGLQTIAQDSAFGLQADTLDRAFRAGMGDVDLEARVLLFDTWRGDQAARLATTRSGFRVLASAGWRFGTASSAQANEPFALALGDGVNAILLRATADAVYKQRAWVSATVRTTTPLQDNAVVRLPGVGLPEFFFLGTPTAVSRTLGQRVDLEVAPRLSLGDKFGVSASWLLRSQAGDRYEPADAAAFETPSGSAQYGAIGVTYSTLSAFTRGRSKFAVEVMFAHEVALSASSVGVPSLVRDRLELRIYRGFPRR